MDLINTFPVLTDRRVGNRLDIYITIEIRDILVGFTPRRMVDFAYVDARGSAVWLLPVPGEMTGTFELFVKIYGAVVCGG